MAAEVPSPTGTHPAALADEALLAECGIRFTRRGGPGGQNRNKVETAAILVHRPTGCRAEANERRGQAENRRVALRRLRLILARSVRHPVEPCGHPSSLWLSRLRAGRIEVSADHGDFPAVLAEALDHLAAAGGDVREAAQELRCTPTQLVRLFRDDPPTLAAINAARRERALPPLR